MPVPAVPVEVPHSGQGGHLLLNAVANYFPVTEWRAQRQARLVETTTSASGLKRKSILRGGSWQCNVPWNSGAPPETYGFIEGAEGTLTFLIGDSGHSYDAVPMIIENVEVVCNAQNDVVRLTVSGYSQGPFPLPTAPP